MQAGWMADGQRTPARLGMQLDGTWLIGLLPNCICLDATQVLGWDEFRVNLPMVLNRDKQK